MSVATPDVASDGAASSAPWPRPRQAWYAVAVFATALMVNFLDRGILNLLVEPIKRDLHLSDLQISVLMGFAFACFYVILGLPIARLADSRSRRAIVGTGIAIFSVMTALCGLAQNFWQLFLCRVGVGVGEACNGPATFSMLADLFPPAKLPRAIGVLNFGFVFGLGTSLLIGGTIVHLVAALPPVTLPLVGLLRPWQYAFFLVGIPGLIVAALFSTVLEPMRRGRITGPAAPSGRRVATVPVREVARFAWGNRATYGPLFVGVALQTVLAFGVQSWTPSFFIRTYGWTIAQIGWTQGLIILIAWPLALLPGGMAAEWLTRRGYPDANMRVAIAALLAYTPFAIAFPLMPTALGSNIMIGLSGFCISFGIGPLNAALQIVTPGEMRGQVTALFLFVFNIIGFGLGSTIVALFTQYVFGSDALLRYSLSTTVAILAPIAALVMASGLKAYGKSVVRARSWV
jgi:MFS family permease